MCTTARSCGMSKTMSAARRIIVFGSRLLELLAFLPGLLAALGTHGERGSLTCRGANVRLLYQRSRPGITWSICRWGHPQCLRPPSLVVAQAMQEAMEGDIKQMS